MSKHWFDGVTGIDYFTLNVLVQQQHQLESGNSKDGFHVRNLILEHILPPSKGTRFFFNRSRAYIHDTLAIASGKAANA